MLLLLAGYVIKVRFDFVGSVIEVIGFTTIGSLYAFRFFRKNSKTTLDVVKLILILSYSIVSILMSFDLQGLYYLQRFVMLSAIVWLILEVINILKDKTNNLNPVLYIGVVIIMLEILFRIMWWPGSSIMHILGLFLIAIGFFIDYSRTRLNEDT